MEDIDLESQRKILELLSKDVQELTGSISEDQLSHDARVALAQQNSDTREYSETFAAIEAQLEEQEDVDRRIRERASTTITATAIVSGIAQTEDEQPPLVHPTNARKRPRSEVDLHEGDDDRPDAKRPAHKMPASRGAESHGGISPEITPNQATNPSTTPPSVATSSSTITHALLDVSAVPSLKRKRSDADEESDAPCAKVFLVEENLEKDETESTGTSNAKANCTMCRESVLETQLAELPGCEHLTCSDCANTMFLMAAKSEGSWPPTCCRREIPLGAVQGFVTKETEETFNKRVFEWTTAPRDRLYCHERTCSEFIPPSQIDHEHGAGRCPACSRETCVRCKCTRHEEDCSNNEPDPNDVLFEALKKEEKWAACPTCERVVDLKHGCNHMECFCKTEFCFLCSTPWKHCKCPQWVEARLLFRAERVVARTDEDPRVVQQRIGELGATCQHDDLYKHYLPEPNFDAEGDAVPRPDQICDECGDDMWYFMYVGCGCGLQICRACLYHRLRLPPQLKHGRQARVPRTRGQRVQKNQRRQQQGHARLGAYAYRG